MSLETFVESVVDDAVSELHTLEPGKVVRYTGGVNPTASVVPVTKLRHRNADGSYVTESRQIIHNVPILYPSGGGFSVSWPLEVGDDVTILYSERSITEWKKSGGEDLEPGDPRRHDQSDALVIPFARVETTGDFVITGDKIKLGSKNAQHPVCHGDKIQELLRILLAVIQTMKPVGNMGVPIEFATDVTGNDGGTPPTYAGGIVAVRAALQAAINDAVSTVTETD